MTKISPKTDLLAGNPGFIKQPRVRYVHRIVVAFSLGFVGGLGKGVGGIALDLIVRYFS